MISLSELRKDRTKYDTGRKRSGKGGKPYNNMKRPILAIDGEGITDRAKRHHYILLAASDGSYISGSSLSTRECFDYLLLLPRNYLIVGFSLNYDICKWFRDISREALETLWKYGRVIWKGYTVRWAPGKYIDIGHKKQSVRIYDVFGFYQHSFVASLEEWKIGTLEQIERIRAMKASRSEFSSEGFEEIKAYCFEECALLVQLVDKLRRALLDIDLTLNQWYGAGAIATSIFQKENMKQFMGQPDSDGKPQGPPEKYSIPIMGAYYGGRFDLYRSGEYQDVYTYDIRSAYPYIASALPCLTHVTYHHSKGYTPAKWGVYLTEWEISEDNPWPPFPFRIADSRQILYPRKGKGWYHASEIQSALRFYGTKSIRIHESVTLTRHCDHVPFAFVPRYFAYRNKLKAEGNFAQLTIKLGLNSLYGKTAQGVGWGDKRPPYQSYLWAGMITAGTRAMLLDAIAQKPDAIIATATDGIISQEPLQLDTGPELGQWEAGQYASFFSVQSGVYETWEGIPYSKQIKSRGFGKAETSFDDIKRVHKTDPIYGTFGYRTTRFVGLGAALMRTDFWKYFGQWVEMDRSVNFYQNKRWPDETVEDIHHMRWYPFDPPTGQEISAEFQPRSSWSDLWSRESAEETLELLIDNDQP